MEFLQLGTLSVRAPRNAQPQTPATSIFEDRSSALAPEQDDVLRRSNVRLGEEEGFFFPSGATGLPNFPGSDMFCDALDLTRLGSWGTACGSMRDGASPVGSLRFLTTRKASMQNPGSLTSSLDLSGRRQDSGRADSVASPMFMFPSPICSARSSALGNMGGDSTRKARITRLGSLAADITSAGSSRSIGFNTLSRIGSTASAADFPFSLPIDEELLGADTPSKHTPSSPQRLINWSQPEASPLTFPVTPAADTEGNTAATAPYWCGAIAAAAVPNRTQTGSSFGSSLRAMSDSGSDSLMNTTMSLSALPQPGMIDSDSSGNLFGSLGCGVASLQSLMDSQANMCPVSAAVPTRTPRAATPCAMDQHWVGSTPPEDGSSILAASVSDCIPGLDTAEDDLCCDDDDTDSEYEDCDDKQPEFIKALTMVFEDWSVTGSNADPASAAAIGYSTALSGV